MDGNLDGDVFYDEERCSEKIFEDEDKVIEVILIAAF